MGDPDGFAVCRELKSNPKYGHLPILILTGEGAIDKRLEDGVSEVDIDSQQILRVFSNLVGNAIKFTPEGGKIIIRADREGEYVHFSVADTGPGIPPDQLPHVFDRYW